MSNFKPKQSILNSLITYGEKSVSELTELTGYSRVTVSKELEYLLDASVVIKSGTKYRLFDNSSFAILKMHKNFAEAVCFNSSGTLLKRNRTEMLFSLPYRDNITFLSTNVQRLLPFVPRNEERQFFCIVCDIKTDVSNIISRKFTVRETRSELIAKALSFRYDGKSVLYLNNSDGFSVLCFNGSRLGDSYSTDKNIAKKLKDCFDIFRPDVVLLEGVFDDQTEKLCQNEKIEFSFLSTTGGLYIDEKQLLLDCLCEI